MAKKSVTFTIKTPHRTLQPKDAVKANATFCQEIEKRAIKESVNQVSKFVRWKNRQALEIVATFFQRVCSRTPIDEDYTFMYINTKGESHLIKHNADKVTCRYDWFIELNGKRVYASDIQGAYSDVFDTVNNKSSIEGVKTYLQFEFGSDIVKQKEGLPFVIGNENYYFATLEYGGYKKDSEAKAPSKKAPEGHGVLNKHSVQAPTGMLRITQMELERLFSESTAKVRDYKNEKSVRKNYSDKELEQLLLNFKASKRLPLEDIKRFIKL